MKAMLLSSNKIQIINSDLEDIAINGDIIIINRNLVDKFKF